MVLPVQARRLGWIERLEEAGFAIRYAENAWELAREIRALRPTIVHAHFVKWNVPAAYAARSVGARPFWHMHSGTLPSGGARNLARRWKYAALARPVHAFFCASRNVAAYLQSNGIAPKRILEVPNGVNLRRFCVPSAAQRSAARAVLGLAPNESLLLFFGRDAHVKGADRLRDALARSGRDVTIGVVSGSAGTLQTLGASRVRDLGVVHDMPALLWAADALALASRTEASPYAVIEARATGLPVVATPLEGVIDALGADDGTRFVAGDDAGAFGAALDAALDRGRVPLAPAIAEGISVERWSRRIVEAYGID